MGKVPTKSITLNMQFKFTRYRFPDLFVKESKISYLLRVGDNLNNAVVKWREQKRKYKKKYIKAERLKMSVLTFDKRLEEPQLHNFGVMEWQIDELFKSFKLLYNIHRVFKITENIIIIIMAGMFFFGGTYLLFFLLPYEIRYFLSKIYAQYWLSLLLWFVGFMIIMKAWNIVEKKCRDLEQLISYHAGKIMSDNSYEKYYQYLEAVSEYYKAHGLLVN